MFACARMLLVRPPANLVSSAAHMPTLCSRVQVKTGTREFFYEVKAKQSPLTKLMTQRLTASTSDTLPPVPVPSLTPLERAVDSFCNTAIVLAIFVSGVLGGMAVTTLLQVYLFNINNWSDQTSVLLTFYAPIALRVNRVYWVLIVIALASAISRRAFIPRLDWKTLLTVKSSSTGAPTSRARL